MKALRLFRIYGYDTMMIAERLGISEAQAEWQLHQERIEEREQALNGVWAAVNGIRLQSFQNEGLLP